VVGEPAQKRGTTHPTLAEADAGCAEVEESAVGRGLTPPLRAAESLAQVTQPSLALSYLWDHLFENISLDCES
jgi:hypothetical protein